jgi:hypothetical protein
LVASWGSKLVGSDTNALMPAFAVLAIALPLGVERVWAGPRGRPAALACMAAQLLIALQATVPLLDGPRDVARMDPEPGNRFVEFLRRTEGDVLNWDMRFVVARAGKVSRGLEGAADELLNNGEPPAEGMGRDLADQIVAACRNRRFAGVIDPPDWLRRSVTFGPPVEFGGLETFPGMPTRYYPLVF